MNLSTEILKAQHIGVRNFKKTISSTMLEEVLVITDRGKPVSVNLPYEELLELIDLFDELDDRETLSTIAEARESISKAPEGIAVSSVFGEFRKNRE
jgi:two-component SAPR family response regulator